MSCVTRFSILRGTSLERLAFTPKEGELVYDTDLKAVFVGDGVTPGGNLNPGAASPLEKRKITTDSNVVLSDDIIYCETATDIQVFLPPANSYQRRLTIVQRGTGIVSVVAQPGETINLNSSIEFQALHTSVDLISFEGKWHVA